MIRILLADDQALIRSGIRSLLEAEDDIEVVAEATDGRQAVALTAEHRPDIALMDIQMPVAATASGGRATNSPIRRRVTEGDSRASPRMTTRSA